MSYQEDNFTAIANAIRAQIGGGEIQATQFASKIGLINSDDAYTVRFIDYDGTVLKEQIVAPGGSVTPPTVTNKPATNLRPALTFQGWNHPQSEFDNVQCDIDAGAIYVPTDGKTHVYLRLNAATGLAIPLYLNKTDTSLMTVDWGDGTTSTSSVSGNVSFSSNYASIGLKHITITGSGYKLGQGSTSTVFVGGSTQVYRSSIISCYVGSGVTTLSASAFDSCFALSQITICQNVSLGGASMFAQCRSLTHINLQDGIINTFSNLLYYAQSLRSISLPYSLNVIGSSAFYACVPLHTICIPINVNSVKDSAFGLCNTLQAITLPQGVTTIEYGVFADNFSNEKIIFKSNTITSVGAIAFSTCKALKVLVIPDNAVAKLMLAGYAFNQCCSLQDIIIPYGVTTIGDYSFNNNFSKTNFSIPDSVTTIKQYAFNSCLALKYIIFNSTTPPTLANVNALSGHPVSCIYFVPDASLSAYQTATNWATYANQIRPYSEFNINDFQ